MFLAPLEIGGWDHSELHSHLASRCCPQYKDGGPYFPQVRSYNLQLLGFDQLCPVGLWQHPSLHPLDKKLEERALKSEPGWRER